MIGAIIQARMGSSRLPNKVMHSVAGKPLLAHCVERVKQSRYIDEVIIATTDQSRDDVIVEWCKENGTKFFRGSEENVLDRYYQAARHYNLDIVIRVTSDCPFVDPHIIDMLITNLLAQNCDYTSNRWKQRSWPHGLDVEVMKRECLEQAWKHATKSYEKEHVTPYILEHEQEFHIIEVPYHEDLSNMRLTVDYMEDMAFVSQLLPILIHKYGRSYKWQDITAVLKEEPELQEINKLLVDIKLY